MILLDTSAIIGWVERGNGFVPNWIIVHDQIPKFHRVSLGELRAGTFAPDALDDPQVRMIRMNTLTTARESFASDEPMTDAECTIFGIVDIHAGRKVSHNDKWVIAAAIVGGYELVTEDERQHGVAEESHSGAFREALKSAGANPLRSLFADEPPGDHF